MISKILKIQNLGRFTDFSNSGNDSLKFLKYTVIFGYNTYGKSTLTTIFKSLKLADQKYLQGKKTFACTDDIVIDILDDKNQHLTLCNGKWSDPNIIVFDNHFINNAVFVGDEIEHKHKSFLYGIFVGEDVTNKVAELKGIRDEQTELEKKRDQVRFEYTKVNLGSFDAFLKIQPLVDIKKKIEAKEKEIDILKNTDSLKELVSASPLSGQFEKFSSTMRKTLDSSAESNIDEHIKNNWSDIKSSKNFLADGVSLLKEDSNTCIFCGQELTPVKKLIDDFKKVFGSTYKETRQEIEKYGEAFLRFDIEAEMSKFSSLGFKCDDILDKKILSDNKDTINLEVTNKLKDLNYIIDCDSDDKPFKIFIGEIKKLHPFFEDIKKQEFSNEKLKPLENDLNTLKLSEYRYSPDGQILADKYDKASKLVETKKTEIDTLRKAIDSETKNAIDKNQKQINIILKDILKADFEIQKLNSKSNLSRSDAHFVDYEFVINGHIIPISNKHSQNDVEPIDMAYFGNTLSDSDKRLLAMAFFISSIQTDDNLKDKIIVLDDPFSSFDSNRKDYLARAIINIENEKKEKPSQVIILTHDDGFLSRLQQKLPTSETKILKIKNSDIDGSILDICDVEEIIEEQYFKDIKYIQDSIGNAHNVNEALGKVRKCLERVLKHKYYFCLDKITIEGGSISSYLDKIDSKCSVKKEILDNNWHEHMHDQHEIMKLSEPEKIQKLRDFLQLLESI